MIDKKKFKKIFGDQLKAMGYSLKSNSWFKETMDTILIFNLQKSDYSDLYYINIAVWLKSDGTLKALKEQFCHIRFRADSFFKKVGYDLATLLDFSNGDLDDQRIEDITMILKDTILPFMQKIEKIDELKKLYNDGDFKGVFLHKKAKEVLSNS